MLRRSAASLPPRDLVLRAQAGDRDAFDRLVRRHEAGVLAVARRYLGEDDARDVAQRAFVCAYVNLPALHAEASFGAWLRRIARNLALNQLRDRRRVERLDDVEDVQDRLSPTGVLLVQDLRHRLHAAVERLPAKQQMVVRLRLFSERSFRDIARLADCSEDAAKSNFHYATRRLRRWLG